MTEMSPFIARAYLNELYMRKSLICTLTPVKPKYLNNK